MFEDKEDVVWIFVEVFMGVVGVESVFFDDFGENFWRVLLKFVFMFLCVVEDID